MKQFCSVQFINIRIQVHSLWLCTIHQSELMKNLSKSYCLLQTTPLKCGQEKIKSFRKLNQMLLNSKLGIRMAQSSFTTKFISMLKFLVIQQEYLRSTKWVKWESQTMTKKIMIPARADLSFLFQVSLKSDKCFLITKIQSKDLIRVLVLISSNTLVIKRKFLIQIEQDQSQMRQKFSILIGVKVTIFSSLNGMTPCHITTVNSTKRLPINEVIF